MSTAKTRTAASSLTCNNPTYVCATNTKYDVHGCCNPASMDACTLYTTCVDNAALSTITDPGIISNGYVAKW